MTPAHALAGRRILITRAAEDAERWAERLRRLGAAPTVFPCLHADPIDDLDAVSALRAALEHATWLLLSSARGARITAQLLGTPLHAGVRVAVVGPATRRAAMEQIGRVDLVARKGTAGALARELIALMRSENVSGASVVIAAAEGGRVDADRALAVAGIKAQRVNVYRTMPVPRALVRRDLGAGDVDDVWLASPSAVTGLLNRAVLPAGVRVITIGPTTSAAATAAGLRVAAEAPQPTLEGMLAVAV